VLSIKFYVLVGNPYRLECEVREMTAFGPLMCLIHVVSEVVSPALAVSIRKLPRCFSFALSPSSSHLGEEAAACDPEL
jgi:hypothetical protein